MFNAAKTCVWCGMALLGASHMVGALPKSATPKRKPQAAQAFPKREVQSSKAPKTPKASKTERLILWDGDSVTRQAGGWSGPNSALNTLQVTKEQAHGGKNSLRWHGEGSGLLNASWNLWNRQAEASGATGFDLSRFRILRFVIKIEAAAGREPKSLNLSLTGWSNRRPSAIVTIDTAKLAANGRWREVVIPVASLLKKPNANNSAVFDARTVWEIGLSSWSKGEQKFDIYLDDFSANS